VRHNALDHVYCSIARSWAVLGDRWTMLVLREAFLRTRRFDDFQRRLGIARNVLAERLGRLVEEGVLERRLYQDRPPRHEYRLTQKGLDLYPALIALMRWGDRYACDSPPVTLVHERCGGVADPRFVCSSCGEEIDPRDMRPEVAEGAFELAAR
jgi:DNA-binding HxlR family transcriptional regulator